MSTTKELRAALRALRTRIEQEALGARKANLLKVRDRAAKKLDLLVVKGVSQ